MKRSVWILAVLLAALMLALVGCEKTEPPTNRAAPGTNVNAAREEVVDKAAIERELLRIENDWPRVLKEKDVEAVRRVEAEDAVFVYPDGSTGGKAQDIKDIESGALTADSWEVTDLKVNVIHAEAAVVTGRSIVKNGKYKMPDGKTIDISGQYRFIDTFARRDGQWKLVAGASAPVRQPPAASPAPPPAATKASPAAATSPAKRASPY
ncbi:MAG: nuclear transport factor 2 family protein [Pyrinomonadaceae bacterium]